jgi:heat shock protein HspQ
MKRVIIILALIFAFDNVYANDKNVFEDEKLIKEVKADMAEPFFFLADLVQQPDVLVYNYEGKLLHSFQKENIDPIAMRNVDLIMEINSQKYLLKSRN